MLVDRVSFFKEADMKNQTKFRSGGAIVFALAVAMSPTISWSDEKDGQVLYETHCITCHNTQVHWRQNRLVKDWTTLRTQIERWQNNIGQRWTREQISDVAKYLNQMFYKFNPSDEARSGQLSGRFSAAQTGLEK
jgi:mono/diheme cytochrome c family protein